MYDNKAIIGCLFSWIAFVGMSNGQEPLHEQSMLRKPVGIVVDAENDVAIVANKASGSISVIDLDKQQVISETKIAERLTCITEGIVPGTFLCTDFAKHELICFTLENRVPSIVWREPVARHPVSVVIDRSTKRCSVASLWSRRVSLFEIDKRVTKTASIDLPYSPQAQCFVNEKLIVSDAFADNMSIIELSNNTVEFTRKLPGHAATTLALSPDGEQVITAQSMLNELAHSVRNDVHWGLMVSNDARWIKLDRLLDKDTDIYSGATTRPLGGAGDAKGDPGALTVSRDGLVVVTLGGVDEIAFGKLTDAGFSYVRVGRRPIAVALYDKDSKAVVANHLDDSVSLVDLETEEELARVALGPERTMTIAERGESLFFDARLAHDRWMSCHSCHIDGHTNGLLNDNFSDQSFGAPKRVLSLLGRHNTAPFAWNGSSESLSVQIKNSIEQTMQSDRKAKEDDVAAITAYLETLPPPPSIDVARGTVDMDSIARGRQVFMTNKCNSCHQEISYTSPETYQVGLEDQLGNKDFNPPSLVGVGQRYKLFHDNRAANLEEVFRKYKHQVKGELSDQELGDLVRFLRSL